MPNLLGEPHKNDPEGGRLYLVNAISAFKYMKCEMFREIYTTYIRPKLEYAAIVWPRHLRSHVELLERVQRNGTRVVPNQSKRREALNLSTSE